MYIKFNNGISSTEGYPYQGNDVFNCRYNATNSIGTTLGYARIPRGNETLLKNIVAEVGLVGPFVLANEKGYCIFWIRQMP